MITLADKGLIQGIEALTTGEGSKNEKWDGGKESRKRQKDGGFQARAVRRVGEKRRREKRRSDGEGLDELMMARAGGKEWGGGSNGGRRGAGAEGDALRSREGSSAALQLSGPLSGIPRARKGTSGPRG